MAEIKDKKYGKTIFYIDGDEIKDKKYGTTLCFDPYKTRVIF